jgi:hypothetical protein
MTSDKGSAGTQIFVGVAIAVLSAAILAAIGLRNKDQVTVTNPSPGLNQPPSDSSPALNQAPTNSVAGTYDGSVLNQTSGQSGNVRFVFNEDTSGRITGTVNITGVLIGSGPLEGHTDGSKIGFTSIEQSTGILITWRGNISGSEITGNYIVSMPPQLKAQGLFDQQGVWKVEK